MPVGLATVALIALQFAPIAQATTYYWDVNGSATSGFGTVVGAWNGTNAFWNSSSTGTTGGTVVSVTTNADDLIIPQATTNTGSITVTNAPSASSITFAANVGPTTTITGSTITIGGTGTSSGIFEASSGANTISSGLIINSAVSSVNFRNTSTGLLTIGAATGAAITGSQTINVGSTSSGGITLNGIIGNGVAGGNVAMSINNTGTGATILSGASTFTGGVTLTAGTLKLGSAGVIGSNGPLGNGGTFTINGGVIDSNGANLVVANVNPVAIGGSFAFSTTAGTTNLALPGLATMNVAAAISANGTGNFSLAGGLNNNGNLLTINANTAASGVGITGDVNFGDGTLTGVGGLTLNGPGVLIFQGQGLTAVNNISGTTTINGGLVRINSGNSSTGTGNLTFNGGVLELYFGGTYTRTLGSGAGQIQILSGVSGFGGQGNSNSIVTLNNNATTPIVWGSAFFNPSVLALQNSTANTNGQLTFTNAIDLNGSTRTISVNGITTAGLSSMTGVISNSTGTAGLIKTGTGPLTLAGINTYNGTTNITGGTLIATNSSSLGSSSTVVLTSTAASLSVLGLGYNGVPTGGVTQTDTNGGVIAISSVVGYTASLSSILSGSNFYLGGLGTTSTYTGAAGNITPGNGALYRLGGSGGTIAFNTTNLLTGSNAVQVNSTATNGGGTVIFGAPQNYTGQTSIATGSFTLSGTGSIIGSTSLTPLLTGTTLNVGDGSATVGTNSNDRLADTLPVILSGGTLSLMGTAIAGTNTTETIGAITQANSASGNLNVTFGGTNTATLNAASFIHTAGNATTLVNGVGLGQDSASAASVARILLATAPTLVGTTAATSAGINASTKDTQIVPYLVGESGATTGLVGTATGTANTFVTYNAATGLRPLNPADEFTNNAYTSGTNVCITAATPATSPASINSLLVTAAVVNAVSITNSSTLTVTSGAVLFTGNGATITGAAGNSLSFDSAEGIITTNSGVTATISATLVGTGGLTKSGSGFLVLSGANTLSGAVAVDAGLLALAGSTALTTANSVTIASGAALNLGNQGYTFSTTTLTINGTGFGGGGALQTTGGSGTTNWNGAVTLGSNSFIHPNGSTNFNVGGTVSLGSFTLTIQPDGGATSIFSQTISGSGGLIKGGGGTLTLSGSNTYTGATAVNGGVLLLANVSALGGNNPGVNGTSSISMASGTTLRSTISGVTVSAPITIAGSVTINAPNNNGGQAFSELFLNGAIGGTGNVTFSSVLNANTIQTVTLGARSNYSGNTLLDTSGGTASQIIVKLGIDNALPTTTVLTIDGQNGSGSGRVAELTLNGFSQTLAGLQINTRSLRVQRVINPSNAAAATLTINGSTDTTFAGFLGSSNIGGFSLNASASNAANGDNFGLNKNGTGTFTLNPVTFTASTSTWFGNTYFGPTKILGGILSLAKATAMSQSPLDTTSSVAGDATNGLRTTVTTLTLGGLIGNKDLASVFTTTSGGYGSVSALTLNPISGATPSYSGVIADGATGMTLTSSGAGTQTLTANNTYTGVTTINSGATLQLGDGSTGHDGTIATSSGITNNGTLVYNRFGSLSTALVISGTGTVTVSGAGSQTLTGTNTFTGATTINSGATLQLGDGTIGNDGTIAASSGVTNNGTLAYNRFGSASSSVAISGTGVVNKLGVGTQTLNATNTYTGATNIQAGTLALGATGSINNSSLISILPTATFDVSAVSGYALAQNLAAKGAGTANVVGAVDAGARTLDLKDGVNIGTLALSSDLSLNGATLTFDLSATTSDQIAVTGIATLAGTNTISVAVLTAASSLAVGSHAYTLLTAGSGLVSSNFALSSTSATVNSTVYNFSLSGDATHEYLDVSAVSSAVSGIWAVNASGSYSTPGNWSGGVPGLGANSAGNDTATFAAAATTVNPIVTLDGVSPVLKGITFNNAAHGYTIAQGTGGTLTLNGGASPATVVVTNGTHTISAPLTLATNTNITLANAGSLTLSGAQAWAGHNVAVIGAGTITISGTQSNASPATFTVNSGVIANINTNGGTGLSLVNGGVMNLKSSQTVAGVTINIGAHVNVTTNTAQPVATGPSVLVTPTLSIASHVVGSDTIWDGYLDLANNKLVVQTGGLSGTALQAAVKQVASQVRSGYNLANGSSTLWMGTGIGSSSAAADTRRIVGLAVFQNNTKSFGSIDGTVSDGTGNAFITTPFGGATVAKNDTLVKFTYFGDTDLDGVITAGDYANIDLAFAHQQTLGPQSGWANGDFDYDGSITAADYSLMDSAFAAQSGALAEGVHTLGGSLSGSLGSVTAVPEPSTWLLGVIGILSLALISRTRRGRSQS